MTRTKRYILGLLFLLAAAPIALSNEQSLLARVTVYWASGGSGSDSWTRQHIAASGAHLRAGHCAVDPRRIPYGSRVILPDGPLLAVDTGSAVRSRRAARLAGRSASERSAIVIDRFFETKGQALGWANRNPQFITVRVQLPNESLTAVQTVRTSLATTSATRMVANNSRSSTIRTVATNSTTQRIVSNPQPQPATLRGTAVVKAPLPKLAASNSSRTTPSEGASAPQNPQQKLLAQYSSDPRSHYGRAVGYMP
jgi:3D (Asp-Asp-Asp) domain-containing protein